jgi:dephospho-CoA kinase
MGSRAIAVMGESGSGKTTAMRTLKSEETYYIDCDGNGLSWRGWRQQYNAARKNYIRCADRFQRLIIHRF